MLNKHDNILNKIISFSVILALPPLFVYYGTSLKLRFPQSWGGWGYCGGLLIFSLDHPERQNIGHTEPDIYIPTLTHEMMHVVESLLKADGDPGLVDVWLTEGLAEVVSGGTAGDNSITESESASRDGN